MSTLPRFTRILRAYTLSFVPYSIVGVQAGIADSRVQLLADKLARVEEELKESRVAERTAVREANTSNAHARKTAIQNDALQSENEDLTGKQTERMILYRDRLAKSEDLTPTLLQTASLHATPYSQRATQSRIVFSGLGLFPSTGCIAGARCTDPRGGRYVRDIGDFMATAGGEYFPGMETQLKRYVDLMLKDLSESYTHREQQLCASIERRLQREAQLEAERARLQHA